MDLDPESPEWTIAWSLKQHARTLLGPKADRVPADLIAKQITGDLREAILRRRREERQAFEDLLSALLRAWHSHQ